MGQELLISFLEHPTFSREIKKFNKKHDNGVGYKSLKSLLEKHFHPTNPQVAFGPTVLMRIDNLGPNIVVYKVHMAVKGLRSGQFPRVCFRIEGNLISFLCYGSHSEDYKDSQLRDLIKQRVRQLDPDVEFR